MTIRPDNVIRPRDAPWLIVDAKYTNLLRWREGKQYFRNEDLYQAFTYAMVLDAPAVLAYPKVDRSIDATAQAGKQDARIVAVDLARGNCASVFGRMMSKLFVAAR